MSGSCHISMLAIPRLSLGGIPTIHNTAEIVAG